MHVQQFEPACPDAPDADARARHPLPFVAIQSATMPQSLHRQHYHLIRHESDCNPAHHVRVARREDIAELQVF